MAMTDIPAWLGTAIIGAVIAALGYLAKVIHQWWTAFRADQAARLAAFQQLNVLLRTSRALFFVQNDHARRLTEMLDRNHPGQALEEGGFERTFVALHDSFTPEEKDLHGIIRSITTSAVMPVNQSMSDWLRNDRIFKTGSLRISKRRELADKLHELEVHLTLWRAKYDYWLTSDPRHALVYLADEEQHGIKFPQDIDALVSEVLDGLK